MSAKVINRPVPAAKEKGREKETFPPAPPIREKGKGKETTPGFFETSCSKPACAYARKRRLPCTCSYADAGAAAYEIVGSCFGDMGDLDLWAWYCRHFNRNAIVEKAHEYASMQRQGEVRDAVTAFQAWLSSEFKVKAPKHLNARPCRPEECPNFEEGGAA